MFCADFVLLVGGPVTHMAFQFADSSKWRGFGHAPKMQDVEIVLVERAHESLWRGRAADDDANGPVEFPSAGIFLERGEHAEPNGRHSASDGDVFLADQIQNAFGVDIRPRQNQARPSHSARIRQAPGVGVKHGSHGEDSVMVADREGIDPEFSERMQHQRAVRVDDTFRVASGAGRVTHRCAIILIDGRVLKVIARVGEEFFVVQSTFRQREGCAAVGHDDDAFKRYTGAALLQRRKQNIIDEQKSVGGMIHDGSDFVRMQTQIQGVKNPASAGHPEKSF